MTASCGRHRRRAGDRTGGRVARAGYRVAGADFAALASAMDYAPATPEDLAQTGVRVQEAGGQWLPVVFDQRDMASVQAGFTKIVDRWGVDVVFANAGVQGFAPLLIERGGGQIIITSSTQWICPDRRAREGGRTNTMREAARKLLANYEAPRLRYPVVRRQGFEPRTR